MRLLTHKTPSTLQKHSTKHERPSRGAWKNNFERYSHLKKLGRSFAFAPKDSKETPKRPKQLFKRPQSTQSSPKRSLWTPKIDPKGLPKDSQSTRKGLPKDSQMDPIKLHVPSRCLRGHQGGHRHLAGLLQECRAEGGEPRQVHGPSAEGQRGVGCRLWIFRGWKGGRGWSVFGVFSHYCLFSINQTRSSWIRFPPNLRSRFQISSGVWLMGQTPSRPTSPKGRSVARTLRLASLVAMGASRLLRRASSPWWRPRATIAGVCRCRFLRLFRFGNMVQTYEVPDNWLKRK